jgi:hypothetical protein
MQPLSQAKNGLARTYFRTLLKIPLAKTLNVINASTYFRRKPGKRASGGTPLVYQTNCPRAHLLSDLRPYSCVSPGCSFPDLVFESRDQWIAHELDNHYQEWWCDFPYDDQTIFIVPSQTEFTTHVQSTHPTLFSPANIDFFVSRAQRPSLYPFTRCPFCETPDELKLEKPDVVSHRHVGASKELQKHIGVHLQIFALLAFLEEDENEEIQSNASNAQVGRSHSDLSSVELDFEEGRTRDFTKASEEKGSSEAENTEESPTDNRYNSPDSVHRLRS